MAKTFTQRFDVALEKLQAVADAAVDNDMDAQSEKITEFIEKLRDEVDFNEANDDDAANAATEDQD